MICNKQRERLLRLAHAARRALAARSAAAHQAPLFRPSAAEVECGRSSILIIGGQLRHAPAQRCGGGAARGERGEKTGWNICGARLYISRIRDDRPCGVMDAQNTCWKLAWSFCLYRSDPASNSSIFRFGLVNRQLTFLTPVMSTLQLTRVMKLIPLTNDVPAMRCAFRAHQQPIQLNSKPWTSLPDLITDSRARSDLHTYMHALQLA